ncbi:MAG: UDP-N-acetylmuramate dehydrogenase [Bacteroidales bacterium]|nr:UDP-N-acetylmuramate dehydrogenase [Bacteroidales bacterium]
MPQILRQFSLKNYNSFGLEVFANYYVCAKNIGHIKEIIKNEVGKHKQTLILSGGSNILFTGNYSGLVIHNKIEGIKFLGETDAHVYMEVGAGEEWDSFVKQMVELGYGGVENLSLIPGYTGAAPIQNIGAYGVETKDVIELVNGIDMENGKESTFKNEECAFGYRDSLFKQKLRGKFMVTSVVFKLTKDRHAFKLGYGNLHEALLGKEVNLRNIRQAVVQIRESKLPDPKTFGNAGSFFKNPVIGKPHFDDLLLAYPTMPNYPLTEASYKVPAAWLIEQCGWKGKVVGNVGAHQNQPLVLVNYGHAKPIEIINLARDIKNSVLEKFGIALNEEVNVV